MICKTCQNPTSSTTNEECPSCWNKSYDAWQKKMAKRQNPDQFNLKRVIGFLLSQHWMHECEIQANYLPKFPGPDTRPRCVIKYTYDDGQIVFLRHSGGPMQGFFWDIYGDDFHCPELALISISQSPPPPRVGVCIPTHGRE